MIMPYRDKGRHPLRQQRRRTKGWRKPEGAVCVTRPGRWGNPYRADDPAEAVRLFEEKQLPTLDVEPLRGKTLLCYCGLDQPCHADVLAWAANE